MRTDLSRRQFLGRSAAWGAGAVGSQFTTAMAQNRGVLGRRFVFENPPFRSCHASTLAESRQGGLVSAWFAGEREGHPSVGIWCSRLERDAWSAPREVADGIQADGTRHPCWNPVLFQPADGPLLLFYKVGPSPRDWWGMLRESADGGATWTAARRLPDGILGPIKNKPIQLASGAILCPTSTESAENPSKWRIHFERTSDLGKTWSTVRPAPATGPEMDVIQPSLLRMGAETLAAVGRSRQGRVFRSISKDLGRTWSAPEPTELPNPNSGTDAVTLADGRHLIVYNHTRRGRSPLNVALSKDAQNWNGSLVLEDVGLSEFSYPACIQTRDGRVHISYTHLRRQIAHVVLDPAQLPELPLWPLV